jgi:hypothetical protein
MPLTDPHVASDVMRLVADTADYTDAEERNNRVCYSCEVVKVGGICVSLWRGGVGGALAL